METEDRHTTRDKRLPCQLLVTGILAFCLILSVAAHLDAQPRGRNQAGSQQIDSRRLNQILTKIEKRLTALEKQRVSHQPAAPAMHQPGPFFGQASLESRVTVLEQKVAQQPAAPAANQSSSSPDLTTIEARLTALENLAGSPQPAAPATEHTESSVGELTCTKLTVVNGAGQPMVELLANDNTFPGGGARFYASDGREMVLLFQSLHHGGAHLILRGASDTEGGIIFNTANTGTGSRITRWDTSIGAMRDVEHQH